MEFGERMRLLIEERGVSIKQLSKDTGVSEWRFKRCLENSRRVKSELLVVVAKYFDVNADYLLGISDKKYRTKL